MLMGISPENSFDESTREVTYGINLEILEGIDPDKSLEERSTPVIEVQFAIPVGKLPFNPMFERRMLRTLLSVGCQQSIPMKVQINPSVLLLKFQEELRLPLGSFRDSFIDFNHAISLSLPWIKMLFDSSRQIMKARTSK